MAKTLGKTELINEVAKTAKIEKTKAKAAVDATIRVISGTLKKGGKVQLTGFGTFAVARRKKRTGVNPQRQDHNSCTPRSQVHRRQDPERRNRQVTPPANTHVLGRLRPPLLLSEY